MTLPSLLLTDKVAIVTGARRGIGEAIALTFAEAGADVFVCDVVIEDGELKAVAEEIQRIGRRSLAVQTDISQKTEVESLLQKTVDEFGGIDILVNNAALMCRISLLELPEDEWDRVMDTNLKGYFLCCQVVGRKMMDQKRGIIINIASGAGIMPRGSRGSYAISKAGVIMLTRVLARELGPKIRINAIAPSTRTPGNQALLPEITDPEILAQSLAHVPLGRRGELSEMGSVALFLVSDASSYIAEAFYYLHTQDKSAWTHELQLTPFLIKPVSRPTR